MSPIPRSHRFELTGTWRENAACRDVAEPEIFDVPLRGSAAGDISRARALCAVCPVVAPCYAWAKADRSYEGVAGGHLWQGDLRKGGRRDVAPC